MYRSELNNENQIQNTNNNEKKTAIIVITYNKIPDLIFLNSCLCYVDYIFITDNGSSLEIVDTLRAFASKHGKRINLTLNKTNLGLSLPINDLVKEFQNYGIYWFYIFDQDAIADFDLFSEVKKAWNYCKLRHIRIGIVVPLVGDKQKTLGANLNLKRYISIIGSAITSGIFTNVDVFNAAGGFDQFFFAYGADIDFTIRVRRMGYKICRLNRLYIVQNYGEAVNIYTLRSRIFFKINQIISLVNLRLNMINAYHSKGYLYNSESLEIQLETSRFINRKYMRIYAEFNRLIQKYVSPILRRGI